MAKRKDFLHKFFSYLQETELFISKYIAKELKSLADDDKSRVTDTFSTNNDYAGKCRNCGVNLEKFTISEDEQRILVETVKKALFDEDINRNTDKEEFDKFINFLNSFEVMGLNYDQKFLTMKVLEQI